MTEKLQTQNTKNKKENKIMQKMNINWTAKTLVGQMAKGKLNFDNAVQRGYTWDNSRKSLLIHSMLYGYAIPAMYFTRDENGVYDSLDGKQRSNAIMEYMSGKFALSLDIPDVYDDEGNRNNFTGMYYEQLPDWAKDRIKDYNLTIYYYEDMTEAEIREFFRRLNNGKPLSSIELTRVNTPEIGKFQQLAKSDAIQNATTEAAKKRFTDEVIAMQLYHMATVEKPDFSTKSFREWANSVKIDERVYSDLETALLVFNMILGELTDKKLAKKITTRTHFVSCAYFIYEAQRSGKTKDEIKETLEDFFSGDPSTDADYNVSVTIGSAKPNAVQTRQRIMKALAEDGEATHEETDHAEESDAEDAEDGAEQLTIDNQKDDPAAV